MPMTISSLFLLLLVFNCNIPEIGKYLNDFS